MSSLDEIANKFDEDCNNIHNKAIKDLIDKNPVLYHYTNYSGLEGILTSRILRQTHSQYLNDSTELVYGQNIILRFLKNFDSLPSKNIRNLMEDFLKKVFNKQISIYVACLSLSKNNLSLCRHNANNGTGFTIGFKDLFKNSSSTGSALTNSTIGKIFYGENEAINVLNQFLLPYINSTRMTMKTNKRPADIYTTIDAKLVSNLL